MDVYKWILNFDLYKSKAVDILADTAKFRFQSKATDSSTHYYLNWYSSTLWNDQDEQNSPTFLPFLAAVQLTGLNRFLRIIKCASRLLGLKVTWLLLFRRGLFPSLKSPEVKIWEGFRQFTCVQSGVLPKWPRKQPRVTTGGIRSVGMLVPQSKTYFYLAPASWASLSLSV